MNPSLKRIILDISDLQKDPIEGAHYYPCEDNIMKGEALVFGPKNTPYENGNYIFTFEFSQEYPYKPPIVLFHSNDGITRFNPNFYKNGKVCLSLLNTWKGEAWSACQSIRSVLITLQMTMNENPLLNEPGVELEKHYSCIRKYNQIVDYKNIEINILRYIYDTSTIPSTNKQLHNDLIEHFHKNKLDILSNLQQKLKSPQNEQVVSLNIYSQMSVLLDYESLINKIEKN